MAEWKVDSHEINAFNVDYIDIEAEGIGSPPVRGDRYTIVAHDPASKNLVASSVEIRFQAGPVLEVGVNGVTDEALLAVVLDRLRCFQRSPYSCRQNSIAITKIEEALFWMRDRSGERMARGVEGTSKV